MKMQRKRAMMMATAVGILTCGASARAAELEVVVEGLETKGRLMIAIMGEADAWDGKAPSLFSVDAKVTSSKMSFQFPVPEGQVAIRLFHDANGNGKLDTNLLGIPSERYGFSQNAGGMGPAAFKDAAFSVGAKGARTLIRLR